MNAADLLGKTVARVSYPERGPQCRELTVEFTDGTWMCVDGEYANGCVVSINRHPMKPTALAEESRT